MIEEMKESITFMQKNLNELLKREEGKNTQASGVYLLSIMLDEQIVKYYRSLNQQAC